jgi:hypothetical protein
MAGKTLAKLLDGKGNVVLLRYREDCASTRQREEGFLETVKKHPDIQVLVDDLCAGGMAADASKRHKHYRQAETGRRHFLLTRAIDSGNAAGPATEQPPWED